MLNFIKEATNAVVTKNENLKKIDEASIDLASIQAKTREAIHRLNGLENQLKEAEFKMSKKKEQLHTLTGQVEFLAAEQGNKLAFKFKLEQEINSLINKNKELSTQNSLLDGEIKKKEAKNILLERQLNELNRKKIEIEEINENPVLIRKKSIGRLCSVLKQVDEKYKEYGCYDENVLRASTSFEYPYIVDLNHEQHKKEGIIKKLEEFSALKQDKELDELMVKFNETHNCFDLVIPEVIDYLISCIKEGGDDNIWIHHTNYMNTKVNAWNFYTKNISVFFKLLMKKGYQVKRNEKFYLALLKDVALKKNYEQLADELYPILQLDQNEKSIEDAIHLFIKIVDEQISEFKYLGFLHTYLVEQGLIDESYNLVDIFDLVKAEQEHYELLKLENELFSEKGIIEEKKITLEDIEVMSGEEFEHHLVKLLQHLGFRAKVTKASGDQGVDIIATKSGKTYAIQAKRYAGAVGNKAVQEVVSGKEYYGADVSWVITNSTFTPSAKSLAGKTNTLLWDGSKLKNIIDIMDI